MWQTHEFSKALCRFVIFSIITYSMITVYVIFCNLTLPSSPANNNNMVKTLRLYNSYV